MRVAVARLLRRGKFHTRVETSDGRSLLLDNDPAPFVGMELDLDLADESEAELRPLRKGDGFPGMVESLF
jgi:hypothetical protein